MQNPHILLLGCGYTLERVAARLPRGSFVVTTRTEARASDLEQRGYLARILDIHSSADVRRFFEEFGAIDTIVDSIPAEGGKLHAPILSEAVKSLPTPVHMIYLSTTGVYGRRDGGWVTEETSPSPQDERARARLFEEEHYLTSIPLTTNLRISAIYGPGRGMIESLRRGTYPRIGGERWSNRVHADDLVQVILRCIEVREEAKGTFNVADDLPAPNEEVLTFCCQRMGISFPPVLSEEEARTRNIATLLGSQRVSNELLKKRLGISFQFSNYEVGFASLLEER